jgi:hypothetical protein
MSHLLCTMIRHGPLKEQIKGYELWRHCSEAYLCNYVDLWERSSIHSATKCITA